MHQEKIKVEAKLPLSPIELSNDISIGMSAYGNYETTLIALRSLFHSADGEFELILVDDYSPDNGEIRNLFNQAKKEHPNTKVYLFPENMEYSGSLNAILSHATGKNVIFLSNDIFVSPPYLSELLAVADKNPAAGIVRGVSNYVDNGLASHNVLTEQAPDNLYELFPFAQRIRDDYLNAHIMDPYLTGDAFLVTRSLLNRIGGLDPLFYGYFADHDFGLRAKIAGFDLLLAQGAFAYHKRAGNFEYLPPNLKKRKFAIRLARVYENWARFKVKYGLPTQELLLTPAAL